MSWVHTTSGSDRLLLVAVAWQTQTSDSILSVTYDDLPMSLVATANLSPLWERP